MGEGRGRRTILLGVVACILIGTGATAGLVSVKNITFNIPGAWYFVDGNFELNTAGTAAIQTYPSAVYDYEVDNVALTMTPMAMNNDDSMVSLGWAMATFEGGGVLTFTGDLRATGSSTVLYSGTILEAGMTIDSSGSWQLKELAPAASLVSISGGSMGLEASNGGLNTGITAGSDTLMVGDMSLAMQFVTPGISDFSGNRMGNAPAIQISAAEVPEPATLIILAVGGLGVLRRRNS